MRDRPPSHSPPPDASSRSPSLRPRSSAPAPDPAPDPPPSPPPAGTAYRSAAPCWRAAAPLALLSALLIALVALGWPPLLEVDGRVAVWLHARGLAHPGWTEVSRALTDWLWDPWTMRLVLALAVVRLWRRGQRPIALWAASTLALTTVVQQVLKTAIGRERPHWREPLDSAQYAAMPSGHAMTAAVTCVLLLWLAHEAGVRRRVWLAGLVAGCLSVTGVSFTRVALGVHWLTDTLAGTLLGTALALAAVGGWRAMDGGTAGRARQIRPWRDRGAPEKVSQVSP